jgi:hypothetical protein
MKRHDESSEMRCRGCAYDLRGLAENRCPECGRAFDPAKPGTFFTQPIDGRRWAIAACFSSFLIPVVAILIGSEIMVELAIMLCWMLLAVVLFVAIRAVDVLVFRSVRLIRRNELILGLALSMVLALMLSMILWIAHL